VSPELFRAASPARNWKHLGKTALQCSVIWTVFLLVLPFTLLAIEARLGIERFAFRGQDAIGAALFAAFSILNLATGAVLAVKGQGTPLPLDCPRLLVIVGPYAYVRNPMAIAGLGQGMAVGLWLGSWLTLVYVGAGVVVWHWGLRPAEEQDLARRFGGAYHDYRAHVRCWWPRVRRYRCGAHLAVRRRALG
jgi:protein-S-isoprenylcysteine O-methyltransferase Ste14